MCASTVCVGCVPQLTSLEQLETLLVQSPALIVLDCHTPACGPCKLMHPIFASNAQHFHNAIFLSVNTEQDDETRVRPQPPLAVVSLFTVPRSLSLSLWNGFLNQPTRCTCGRMHLFGALAVPSARSLRSALLDCSGPV